MPEHAPAPSVRPQGPARRRFTREDIIRLGRAGDPWGFLPVAGQALHQAPNDAGLRFLTAANLARLGLRTLAGEQLDRLPPEATREPDVRTLAEAVAKLPDDRVPGETLAATAQGNARVLIERGVDLDEALAAWLDRLAGVEAFRARDGNVIRRVAAGEADLDRRTDLRQWMHLRDATGEAARLVREHLSKPVMHPPPFVIEGVDPPWLVRAVAEALPPRPDGYAPRLTLLQEDPGELLDGLALADLGDLLGQPRVEVILGPDAASRLRAALAGRHDRHLGGAVVCQPSTRARVSPSPDRLINEAKAEQQRRCNEVGLCVHSAYEGRDAAYWSGRYAEALGGGEPLRVLIPTCRYSTYIQHASRDLARAFERAGHRAEVLIEPDEHSTFSALSYLEAIDRLSPDLVVLINYPRATLDRGLVPQGVPFVCWIQDAMAHLFDRAVGESQTALDFLCGYLKPELFERYGYDLSRAMPAPVVADDVKFHDGPVESSLSERLACEVACVTHHSETPEAMHTRLVGTMAGDRGVARTLEALRPRVLEAAKDAMGAPALKRLPELVREASVEATGRQPDQNTAFHLHTQYALPLYDRALRHETLEWSASICKRRGWRLRLFGRGWDEHPTLSRFDAGELPHGEALRASYQAADVHLHCSVHGVVHQRVMECALSGGLPLCRLHADVVERVRGGVLIEALRRGVRLVSVAGGLHALAVDDLAEQGRFAVAQLARLGLHDGEALLFDAERVERARLEARRARRGVEPTALLPELADLTFSDEASLEARLTEAIQQPRTRVARSASVRAAVADGMTHGALVRRLVNFVADRLAASSAPSEATHAA